MVEEIKIPAEILIGFVVITILVSFFILPMIFEIFIGRGVCKFIGHIIVEGFLRSSITGGPSVTAGPTHAGVDTLCEFLPF